MRSWSPQSHRRLSSRSPVKHDECSRTSGAFGAAQRQHDRLLGLELHPVGDDSEAAPRRRQVGLCDPLHELLAGAAVTDQLFDRDDLKAVLRSEGEEPVAVRTVA